MARKKVYVTRMLPEAGVELLREHYEVEVNPEDRVLSREELMEKVKGRDAVLCLLTDPIDDAVLAAAGPTCRIFANYAVGYNNIDVAAATRRGIAVTNTPGVLDDATADLAWALLMAAARRIVEADRFTREGRFHGWGPMMYLGRDITGKTLGLFGAGRIGANFARKARGWDMRILYHNRTRNEAFERETGAEYASKEQLLEQSDFLSLHVPLTPETKHLIGEPELKRMKKTAILINTARGPVVDEQALVKALREGVIWGAGLDVYEREPELEAGLRELDNVVLAPHIASATIETREKMALMAARSIVAVLGGERPLHCVNPEVLE